jgi:hypothetical protein
VKEVIHKLTNEAFDDLRYISKLPPEDLADSKVVVFAFAGVPSLLEGNSSRQRLQGCVLGATEKIGEALAEISLSFPPSLMLDVIASLLSGFVESKNFSDTEKKHLVNALIKWLKEYTSKTESSDKESYSLDEILKSLKDSTSLN